ncbi:MAG TPA: M56 family metallopeptidase [Nocardioidaceae bacterium]|nr:M56 family metallopeptidase [Nocardioidaceae bacterium]
MTTAVLSVLAVLLSGPVPSVLARVPALRRAPRAAMTLWQAVALAAVLSALGAGLSLVTGTALGPAWYGVALTALLLTSMVLARLLLSGHRVGTRVRAARRRHREAVDVLATPHTVTGDAASREAGTGHGLRVLDHDAPVAYCVPGLARSRVVVSAGTLGQLAPEELAAVLAHEHAHLRARHDLVLEAFTVLHEAFPRVVSSGSALREVRLLVEVLADRAARRTHGRLPLARALVSLADSHPPAATLGAGGAGLVERIELLRDERPHRVLAAVLYAAAAAVVVLPTVFVAFPWLAGLGVWGGVPGV